MQIIYIFNASYFQERKSLQESIKILSENLTKLKEEINRTQRHLLKNVSFFFFFAAGARAIKKVFCLLDEKNTI